MTMTRLEETRPGLEYIGDIEASGTELGVDYTLNMSFEISIDPADFNGYLMTVEVKSMDTTQGTFRKSLKIPPYF